MNSFKKIVRVILLLLAFCALPVLINQIWQDFWSLRNYFANALYQYPDLSSSLTYLLSNVFCNICGMIFTVAYLVFTLKNGFGAELYNHVALTIEEIKQRKKEKENQRREAKVRKLQQEIETLNTKSDE